MKLLNTDTLETARYKLNMQTSQWIFKSKKVPILEALDQICAQDILAQVNVPSFRRSTVDGYAVIAEDTYGSANANPTFFDIAGQIPIEASSNILLKHQQAVMLQTGSMVPDGATAVIMKEFCETYATDKLLCYKPVSNGEHMIQIGEDIKKGECLIRRGQKLDHAGIGILASLGISTISVYIPPKIAIISTGDELLDLNQQCHGSQIYDINSYTLSAAASEYGMDVTKRLCIKDDYTLIKQAIETLSVQNDIVILSGGSSKGNTDYTADILDEFTGNVFTHGIAIRPGKPTILAFDSKNQTLLAGLPGHPLAAILMFRLIICHWMDNKMAHVRTKSIKATLSENVCSNEGRTVCQLVRISSEPSGLVAHPLYTQSGNISYMLRADGYILIDRNCEGLHKGMTVTVEVL